MILVQEGSYNRPPLSIDTKSISRSSFDVTMTFLMTSESQKSGFYDFLLKIGCFKVFAKNPKNSQVGGFYLLIMKGNYFFNINNKFYMHSTSVCV